MDIARIISSHFRFNPMAIYLLKKLIICVLMGRNNCGYVFGRELIKFILTILKRNISLAKPQTNKNAHAQINSVAKSSFILPNGNPPLG